MRVAALRRSVEQAYRRGSIAGFLEHGAAQHGGTDEPRPVQVDAWIRSIRRQKHVSFISLTDGSSHDGLQAVVENHLLQQIHPDAADAPSPSTSTASTSLGTGASVSLRGTLVSKAGKQGAGKGKGRDSDEVELRVDHCRLLGSCDGSAYPIQKKEQTLPFLRRNAHLRARTSTIASMLRVRDRVTRSAYDYFAAEGFLNATMPVATSSDCEGAGEVFSILHGSTGKPFYDRPTYLSVSGQLHLEALAVGGSLNRVWHLGPAFRAERSDTNRHLSEFWMLEAEQCFTESLDDVMRTVEGAVRYLARDLAGARNSEHDDTGEVTVVDEILAQTKPWKRMTYAEAIRTLQIAHEADSARFQHSPRWSGGLRSEHERYIADQFGPTFVTDYPESQKPFYMRKNGSLSSGPWDDTGNGHAATGLSSFADADEPTVACFDLLVPRIGELAGGSLREERLGHLESAMRKRGMRLEDYQWYLDLRRFGTVPHGGFGLGWERLISWMTGIENVRECIAFPRGSEGTVF